MNEVFIKYNTPSSKNSKINGKFFSKSVQKYLKNYGIKSFSSRRKEVVGYSKIPITFPVEELKTLFLNRQYPIVIGFFFIRDSKRRWDIINIMQIILDLLVAFSIIEDDSMEYVIPTPFKINDKWYSINKDNPGVILRILE